MHNNGGFEADHFEVGGIHGNGKGQLPPTKSRRLGEDTTETTDFGNFRATSNTTLTRDDADKSGRDDENEGGGGGGARRCLRRFASIMLSHIGTLLIVCLYVAGGGFLFNYLETNNEIESCKTSEGKFWAKFTETVNLVYTQAQDSNATEAQLNVKDSMMEFAKTFYALNVNPEFNCSSMPDTNLPTWNFVNAAYFCVTIVTTIGYGHISPMTQWGQIVCMIYGILGIPLMLLFLSKIGDPTAMLFRAFYLNIFCFKCFVKRLPNEKELMANGGKEQHQTGWAAAAEEGEAGDGKKPPPKVVEVVEEDEDEEEEEEEEENEVVSIPITVTLMLLTIYIVIGAAVFRFWEEWTIVEGTYFSFITLSTIGFGDYVPGRNGPFNDTSVIIELLIGCIYCIFGLALLSMCINLIQDEMTAKFRWIGSKLGVSTVEKVDSEDDEDDEDEDDSEEESSGESTEEEDYESSRGSSRAKKRQQLRHRGGVESSA